MSPAYRVRIADDAYWREQIKCQFACPVHTDARGYVRAIAEGDYELAYLIARGPNPLASICGRICGAPCEAACRRGTIDQPIAIRALKRFVCERSGPESFKEPGKEQFSLVSQNTSTRLCDDPDELRHLLNFLANHDFPKPAASSMATSSGRCSRMRASRRAKIVARRCGRGSRGESLMAPQVRQTRASSGRSSTTPKPVYSVPQSTPRTRMGTFSF